jgi:hypothetical protein
MKNDVFPRGFTPKLLATLYPLYGEDYWRKLLRSGAIPGGSRPRGKWIISQEDVERFLESGRDAA